MLHVTRISYLGLFSELSSLSKCHGLCPPQLPPQAFHLSLQLPDQQARGVQVHHRAVADGARRAGVVQCGEALFEVAVGAGDAGLAMKAFSCAFGCLWSFLGPESL